MNFLRLDPLEQLICLALLVRTEQAVFLDKPRHLCLR
jgi:hypothetical protein